MNRVEIRDGAFVIRYDNSETKVDIVGNLTVPELDAVIEALTAARQDRVDADDGSDRCVAIDPQGCGCTECIIGLYVPMEHATDEQYRKLFLGSLRNHTGIDLSALGLMHHFNASRMLSAVRAHLGGQGSLPWADGD